MIYWKPVGGKCTSGVFFPAYVGAEAAEGEAAVCAEKQDVAEEVAEAAEEAEEAEAVLQQSVLYKQREPVVRQLALVPDIQQWPVAPRPEEVVLAGQRLLLPLRLSVLRRKHQIHDDVLLARGKTMPLSTMLL